jgi:hypothetical protein
VKDSGLICRSSTLGCLLLLAAANNLCYFDGVAVPREPGFTRVLVKLCKRKWEDERFETLDRTGVFPDGNDVWD